MKPNALLSSVFLLSVIGTVLSVPQGRIVGGDDAVLGQVPYQGGLSIGGLPTCGAVILSDRYALTSLLCVCSAGSDRPWPPQLFTVAAGTIDLYTGGSRITLEEIIVNPNYSDLSTGIALLKLSKPLTLSEYIQPIALAKVNPPKDAEVEISGWGRIKDDAADMYRTLQINSGTVLDSSECTRTLGRAISDEICVGHPRKNGICRGDFGGPAVYNGQLVGIASYVVGECGSMLPDVFVSVAQHYDWIVEHMTK